MTREVRILVTRGSGATTPTIVQEAAKGIAQRTGANTRVSKATIAEAPERQRHVDIMLTTANYRQSLEKLYMGMSGLISRASKVNTEEKLEELMKKVTAEQSATVQAWG